MAIQWLRCGHHVYVVSSWRRSRAACTMLYYLLKTETTPGQPHLLQYEFIDEKHVEKAVNYLSQAAVGGSLYVIADEVVREYRSNFQTFCNKLLTQIPGVHLWAASCYHGLAPKDWHEEYLTRPLRSPPVVVREVQKARDIVKEGTVHGYSDRGVPDHTDGPSVQWLYHGGEGHLPVWLGDCNMCGRQVANFLHSLREVALGQTIYSSILSGYKTPPVLQWRDVLVLCWEPSSDNSGIITGLIEAGIPVRVMKEDDIEDVATARSDVVWVADGCRVQGLERKVVVCLGCSDLSVTLHNMSRCTSQLVIVCPDPNISSQV
ncbi:uncharacterized protein LOC112576250 [Pomacea canaliculata]|uniref:uncharacterized protein LOC112576250 n=1 Tax=Pomacea canaliculata TaxID=400727 RepID=UPI000D73A280|nr:uncharacterized protein LOC112576250 [Pomacea canaliculata]